MYGGQGLGMLRLLAASQIIDECLDLPTGNDYGGGPGNMIPPPLRELDRFNVFYLILYFKLNLACIVIIVYHVSAIATDNLPIFKLFLMNIFEATI